MPITLLVDNHSLMQLPVRTAIRHGIISYMTLPLLLQTLELDQEMKHVSESGYQILVSACAKPFTVEQ